MEEEGRGKEREKKEQKNKRATEKPKTDIVRGRADGPDTTASPQPGLRRPFPWWLGRRPL